MTRTLNIDRLCEAVNSAGEPAVTAMTVSLKETFPEIIWTRDHAGRLHGATHHDHKPVRYIGDR